VSQARCTTPTWVSSLVTKPGAAFCENAHISNFVLWWTYSLGHAFHAGLQWTRHTGNSSHVTSSLFHQTVNSSQRLSQGKVNSPHGDLVTLEARWPSRRWRQDLLGGWAWFKMGVHDDAGVWGTFVSQWGSVGVLGDFVPQKLTQFFYTISVSNCDAYCLLQTIKLVQTYTYNFHITITILSVVTQNSHNRDDWLWKKVTANSCLKPKLWFLSLALAVSLVLKLVWNRSLSNVLALLWF